MAKKRFFTKNHERVGKKSGKPRGKYKQRIQLEEITLVQQQIISLDKSKPQQLPNISQKITEKERKQMSKLKTIILSIGGIILFCLTVWQTIGLVQKSVVLKNVVSQRANLSSQMQLWESIALRYPGYRDAYFQAALLAYRLGNITKEKKYLETVLQIDPNYGPAKNLAQISE